MANYNRKCKTCGRWINIRQMPQGQWVAFEGDEQHKCKKPPVPGKPTRPSKPVLPDDGFPDINVPSGAERKPATAPTPPPKPKSSEPEFPPINVLTAETGTNRPETNGRGDWSWLWWVVVIAFILIAVLSGRK